MNEAKVRLSKKEMELVTSADLILTKNEILRKTQTLLGQVLDRQQRWLPSVKGLPAEVVSAYPKISKGENYRGLPYQVLDYPRYFHRENVFAVRTLFWWGHFFSVTLHLSGIYKKLAQERVTAQYEWLSEQNYYCCINQDEWEHHFEEDNYLPVSKLEKGSFITITGERSFIKLSRSYSLEKWDEMTERLFTDFRGLIEMTAG